MKKDEIILLKKLVNKNVVDLLCSHILKCHQRFVLAVKIEGSTKIEKEKEKCKYGYYRSDTSNAYSMYGNLIVEDLLDILTDKISDVLKVELIPTYSFVSLYEKGTELKKHIDRPECEISMSLCLGYEPDDIKWPIHIGDKSIDLEPGDAVVYKGRDLTHWRYPFQGDYQAQAFLHWNDKNGPYGEIYKFDNRPFLGHESVGFHKARFK